MTLECSIIYSVFKGIFIHSEMLVKSKYLYDFILFFFSFQFQYVSLIPMYEINEIIYWFSNQLESLSNIKTNAEFSIYYNVTEKTLLVNTTTMKKILSDNNFFLFFSLFKVYLL